jgi:prevent-host-death family protein
MIVINMHEAKTTLSQLVEMALHGETVIIARRGVPAVRLEPVNADASIRPIGLGATAAPAGDTGAELLSATNPDVYTESATDPLSRKHRRG